MFDLPIYNSTTAALPVTASPMNSPALSPPHRDSYITRPPPAYTTNPRNSVTRPRVFSAPSSRRSVTFALERGPTGSESSAATSRSVSEEPNGHLDTNHPSLPMHALDLTLPYSRPSEGRPWEELRRINSLSALNFNLSEIALIEASANPEKTDQSEDKAELPTQEEGEAFILVLARALMKFGSPSHRIESQLTAVSIIIGIGVEVNHLPKCTLIIFRNRKGFKTGSATRLVKTGDLVELGRLRELHCIYRRVIHRQQSAKEATKELKALVKKAPIYSVPTQIALAVAYGMVISPMAFKGSVLDLLVAGLLCGAVTALRAYRAKNNIMYGNFVDIACSMFVSFVARGLSSLQSGIFCYSAIANSALVKLFPKYLIICGSLELASKQIVSGSVKIVYAIIWSMFLGLTVTMGSDFYFIIDQSALQRRLVSTDYLSRALHLRGVFKADGSPFLNIFMLDNNPKAADSPLYTASGCFRDPTWPWYLQAPPLWTLFFLVPLFSIFSAFASFQPARSRELLVMVIVSSCSYAANRAVHTLISYRNDACSAMGAFVIGTMGHLYSRIFHGTAFISMFNGIGFLVPSAIVATGGFSQNYRGQIGDHYTASIELAMKMLQVALGTTFGLFVSTWIVYSFGAKKKGALWAF